MSVYCGMVCVCMCVDLCKAASIPVSLINLVTLPILKTTEDSLGTCPKFTLRFMPRLDSVEEWMLQL